MALKPSDNWMGCLQEVKKPFFIFTLIIFLSSPSSLWAKTSKVNITVMAYNVENLFDAIDDGPKQEDITFLPMEIKKTWPKDKCLEKAIPYRKMCQTLDWTEEKYQLKLQKIAHVLLDYNNSKGADVISLEELENKRVIRDLWQQYLKSRGYLAPIHFESEGGRGIEVGMLSRFPLAAPPKVHPIDLSGTLDHPTRDILEARFSLPLGQELRVTANHWPSQNNSSDARLRAAEVLKEIANEAKEDGVLFVGMGDFNTLPSETPNPIADNIADNTLRNLVRPLVDMQSFMGLPTPFPAGSYFYKKAWQPLDRFLVSKNLFKGTSPVPANNIEFEIFSPSYLFTEQNIPFRFNFHTGEGYSDHLPIVLKLTETVEN